MASLLDTLNIEETIGAKQRTLMPWLLPKYMHVWTIGKLPFVELVAWEHADFGMHTILRIQQMDRLRVVLLHSDEQTLIVTELCC
jgi:hypothetical protein